MASGVANASKGGTVNWASGGDDIRIALVDNTYVFDPDRGTVRSALTNSGSELSGTGYARKKTYNRTTTEVAGSDKLRHDCNDTTWTGLDAGTVHGAVYYINNASETLAQVIAYTQLASDVVSNGGDFTLQVGSDGVYVGLPDA